MSSSRKRAPSDSICSLTAERTSKACTIAPSRREVAIAWRPATPAPSTSTLAGRTVPAAVVRGLARAGLDGHLESALDEALDYLGHQCDAALTRGDCLGN